MTPLFWSLKLKSIIHRTAVLASLVCSLKIWNPNLSSNKTPRKFMYTWLFEKPIPKHNCNSWFLFWASLSNLCLPFYSVCLRPPWCYLASCSSICYPCSIAMFSQLLDFFQFIEHDEFFSLIQPGSPSTQNPFRSHSPLLFYSANSFYSSDLDLDITTYRKPELVHLICFHKPNTSSLLMPITFYHNFWFAWLYVPQD